MYSCFTNVETYSPGLSPGTYKVTFIIVYNFFLI